MCILINHPANTNFSSDLLIDFFDYNSDGFGAMYAEEGKLVIIKTLGTPAEIEALYATELAHRDCVIHYRMKTHGDIDLDNCHPYRVTDDVWLAHNGILSMGNPVYKHKSDTWHFIEYVLRPILEANPNALFDDDFQEYLESMIGSSNKFALMHSSGKTIIINERAGVMHEGAWLSNTYAWSAHKHGHGNKYYSGKTYPTYTSYPTSTTALTASTKHTSKSLSSWDNYEDMWDEAEATVDKGVVAKPSKKQNYNKVLRAAFNSYRRGSAKLVDWVLAAPEKAEYLLLEWYGESYDNEMNIMVNANPDEAAELIADLFDSGSVNESSIHN